MLPHWRRSGFFFLRPTGQYDQIRYLDKNGMEKIRVNLNGGTANAVPDDELQNKYDRYYFSMLPEQRNPAIVISPADLNVEHGSVEIPYKPIIRFSLPLYDGDGEFNGALILNYLAENLFVGIQSRFNQEGNQLNIGPSARNIVLYHHENWDGSGYMSHLKNEEIPLEARLVSLADVYDALRTERPYKKAFTHEKACAVILKEKGRKFDPEIIDCFLKIEEKFNRISVELADPSEN